MLWAGFHPYRAGENGDIAGGGVRIGTETVLWAGFHPYRRGQPAGKRILVRRIGSETVQWAGFHPYRAGENGDIAGGGVWAGTEQPTRVEKNQTG